MLDGIVFSFDLEVPALPFKLFALPDFPHRVDCIEARNCVEFSGTWYHYLLTIPELVAAKKKSATVGG